VGAGRRRNYWAAVEAKEIQNETAFAAFAVVTGLLIVLLRLVGAGILLVSARQNLRGGRTSRIVTWVLSGLMLCCPAVNVATLAACVGHDDSPGLRDALARRLVDDDADTLAEASHGLAVRGDPRATRPLLRFLASPPETNDRNVIVEALHALAAATADPRLYPHLVADRDTSISDTPDGGPPEALQTALARYATTQDR
jgi:hypothetical protein